MLIILVDRVVMKQGVERGILRGVPRPIAPRSTGDEIGTPNLSRMRPQFSMSTMPSQLSRTQLKSERSLNMLRPIGPVTLMDCERSIGVSL